MFAQRAVAEGWEGSGQTILLARRGRTIGMCSLDVRSEGQSGHSPEGKVGKIGKPLPGLLASPGKSIAKQSEGRAGEKVARNGRPSSPPSSLVSRSYDPTGGFADPATRQTK